MIVLKQKDFKQECTGDIERMQNLNIPTEQIPDYIKENEDNLTPQEIAVLSRMSRSTLPNSKNPSNIPTIATLGLHNKN